MMSRRKAVVVSVDNSRIEDGIQKLATELGPAINFTEFADLLEIGNTVLVNCTATDLKLGTGGYDFVIARLDPPPSDTPSANRENGHLLNSRYTPCQLTEHHVEETVGFNEATSSGLLGMPVVVCELHSMIAPVAMAISLANLTSAYVMTDSAALHLGMSDLVAQLRGKDFLGTCYATGQATAGPRSNKAVSVHGALLHARHLASPGADVVVVAPGPGQTGTGTKYGFSGVEQASILDTVAALDGTPILCVRASSGDGRERHQGVSHHTLTILELVRSRCVIALTENIQISPEMAAKNDLRYISRAQTQGAIDSLRDSEINVTTMGRMVDTDPLFFHSAAAAGIIAAQIAGGIKDKDNG